MKGHVLTLALPVVNTTLPLAELKAEAKGRIVDEARKKGLRLTSDVHTRFIPSERMIYVRASTAPIKPLEWGEPTGETRCPNCGAHITISEGEGTRA